MTLTVDDVKREVWKYENRDMPTLQSIFISIFNAGYHQKKVEHGWFEFKNFLLENMDEVIDVMVSGELTERELYTLAQGFMTGGSVRKEHNPAFVKAFPKLWKHRDVFPKGFSHSLYWYANTHNYPTE